MKEKTKSKRNRCICALFQNPEVWCRESDRG